MNSNRKNNGRESSPKLTTNVVSVEMIVKKNGKCNVVELIVMHQFVLFLSFSQQNIYVVIQMERKKI